MRRTTTCSASCLAWEDLRIPTNRLEYFI
jgi:hypothetical protein